MCRGGGARPTRVAGGRDTARSLATRRGESHGQPYSATRTLIGGARMPTVNGRGAWSGWTVRGPAPRERDSEGGPGPAGRRIRHLALDWTPSVPHPDGDTLNR